MQVIHKLEKMIFKAHDWSYTGECGPQTWGKEFAGARGHHQSPINIETNKAQFDSSLLANAFSISFDTNSCAQIKNTGHTFQVDSRKDNKTILTGGPTKNKYQFLQFHMHWGDSLDRGSEHLVDNKAFPAEMHFVFWNSDLYSDPKKASESSKNDGLIVIGCFISIGQNNPEFEKLAGSIQSIHLKDEHVPIGDIDLAKLLPDNLKDYWTYPGSLTTPPCNECVQWVLLKTTIEISEEQLEKCHHLYNATKEKLCNDKTSIRYNDRPVCSMGDRIVRKSFQDERFGSARAMRRPTSANPLS